MRAILLTLVLLVVGCGSSPQTKVVSRPGEPDVMLTESNDAEMSAAIKEAKRTLPDFIKKLENPGKNEFSVKARMTTPDGGGEHIWVADLTYKSGQFTGVLDNEPVYLTGKKAGDQVTFPESDVTDWIIMNEAGDMQGGFTVAVLKKRQGS